MSGEHQVNLNLSLTLVDVKLVLWYERLAKNCHYLLSNDICALAHISVYGMIIEYHPIVSFQIFHNTLDKETCCTLQRTAASCTEF